MSLVLSMLLVAAVALLLVQQLRHRRTMIKMDAMLDRALRGDYEPGTYDESQLSKIESKLNRFLNAGRLKREQIEREQNTVRTLIGDISHQTKTPISNVLLYSQLLCEQQSLPPQVLELVAQIQAGAEKLGFLIQALVKTSRLESGILKMLPQRYPLGELVESALEQAALIAKQKGIQIYYDPAGGQALSLYDHKWCTEALYNILDNAVKYTPRGGVINVSVIPYELFHRIDVADSGQGIAPEDLPRVFGRFWRAAHSADSEGVGIGLYLAREIVAACGGYIKVRSELGIGSTFSLFLPAAPLDAAGPQLCQK